MKNSTANIILDNEGQCFPPTIRNKTRMSILTTCTGCCPGRPCQCNKARKRKMDIQIGKRDIKLSHSLTTWLSLWKLPWALAGAAQWIEHWPVNQRVSGSIPSQGTCLGCGPGYPVWGLQEATKHWCFSPLSFSLPSSRSKNKYFF